MPNSKNIEKEWGKEREREGGRSQKTNLIFCWSSWSPATRRLWQFKIDSSKPIKNIRYDRMRRVKVTESEKGSEKEGEK